MTYYSKKIFCLELLKLLEAKASLKEIELFANAIEQEKHDDELNHIIFSLMEILDPAFYYPTANLLALCLKCITENVLADPSVLQPKTITHKNIKRHFACELLIKIEEGFDTNQLANWAKNYDPIPLLMKYNTNHLDPEIQKLLKDMEIMDLHEDLVIPENQLREKCLQWIEDGIVNLENKNNS